MYGFLLSTIRILNTFSAAIIIFYKTENVTGGYYDI